MPLNSCFTITYIYIWLLSHKLPQLQYVQNSLQSKYNLFCKYANNAKEKNAFSFATFMFYTNMSQTNVKLSNYILE